MRKPSNGNKVCAFANCKSDGRTLPKDTTITFIPFAKPCTLYTNEAIDILLGKNIGGERHKPADCAQCSRALQWIHLCRRADSHLKNLLDITKAFYVCSNHFIDGKPTELNPNPLPANISVEQEMKKRRAKRKSPKERLLFPSSKRPRETSTVKDGLSVTNEEPDALNKPTRPSNTEENDKPVTVTHSQSHREVSCQTELEMNMESFAKQKMLTGWGSILNGTQAFFVKYNMSTCASLIDVRVLHASPILQCETLICGNRIGEGCELHKEQTAVQTYAQLDKYMRSLETTSLCKGICDKTSMEEHFKEPKSGKYCHVTTTVRSLTCKLFSRGRKCIECLKYDNRLKARIRCGIKKKDIDHKHCNNRFLDRDKLIEKAKEYRQQLKSSSLMVQRLRSKLKRVIQAKRFRALVEDNDDTMKLLKTAKEMLEDGSEFGIFLREQLNVAQRKSCKGYKWNSTVLQWCLYIYKLSPVTYAALRAAAYLVLPSERKLRDVNSWLKSAPGYHDSLPANTADVSSAAANVELENALVQILS